MSTERSGIKTGGIEKDFGYITGDAGSSGIDTERGLIAREGGVGLAYTPWG